MIKKLLFLLFISLSCFSSSAQVVGDYRSLLNNGNWTSVANWQYYNGSAWVPAFDYPGQSGIAQTVTISNNLTTILNVTPLPITNLIIETGAFPSSLSFSNNEVLNVIGSVTIQKPTGTSAIDNKSIIVGDGTLSCAVLNMEDPGGVLPDCILSIGSGTVNVNNSITMAGIGADNKINFSNAGALNINGGTITGGQINPGIGTVSFNDPGTATVPVYNYNNLIVNTGTVGTPAVLAGNINITGDLTVSIDKYFELNGNTITLTGADGKTVFIYGEMKINNSGAALSRTGINATLLIGASARLFLSTPNSTLPEFDDYLFNTTNSYVVYDAVTPQTIAGNDIEYGVLQLDGGDLKTATSNFSANVINILNFTTLTSAIPGAGIISIKTLLNKTNSSLWNAGNDKVMFIGNANAFVNSSNSISFYDVEIAKDLPAHLTVNCDLQISGTLTLTTGKVFLGVHKISLVNGAPNAQLIGGDANSYIVATGAGRLRRVALISMPADFPVGSGSHYLPVELVIPASSSNFEVKAFNGATIDGVQGGTAFPDKTNIVDAIWTIDRTSGSGAVDVDLKWDAALEGSNFTGFSNSQIGISHYNGISWDNATATIANNTSNYVISNFSSFSPFGVGLINVPLPVKFGPIRAYEKQKGIQVDWKIYSELNVQHYTVERSADGVRFAALGTVAALNSTATTDYGFFDASPVNGNSFYRIRSTEIGGAVTYSTIVKVTINGSSSNNFTLYPNPVMNRIITLQQGNLEKGSYAIRIFNTTGMLVMQEQFKHTGGAFTQQLPLNSNMVPGNYIVETIQNGIKKGSVAFTVQ